MKNSGLIFYGIFRTVGCQIDNDLIATCFYIRKLLFGRLTAGDDLVVDLNEVKDFTDRNYFLLYQHLFDISQARNCRHGLILVGAHIPDTDICEAKVAIGRHFFGHLFGRPIH